MRKVIVVEWMTLDGVVQAPGAPEEDTSGGFQHGGWHLPYFDDLARSWVVEGYATAGGFLFGHRTYENLAGYWPNASEEEQVIAQPLNTKPKYVASRTPIEPLAWQNSTVLKGDLAEAVLALKQEDGGDLHVIGSSQLVRSLLAHDLVDEFRVMIDPLLLGGGKRIFPDDSARRRLPRPRSAAAASQPDLVERSDPPFLPFSCAAAGSSDSNAIPQDNVSAPAESLSRPVKAGYLLAFIGTARHAGPLNALMPVEQGTAR